MFINCVHLSDEILTIFIKSYIQAHKKPKFPPLYNYCITLEYLFTSSLTIYITSNLQAFINSVNP